MTSGTPPDSPAPPPDRPAKFLPPTPVGEPYRGDPGAAYPFATDADDPARSLDSAPPPPGAQPPGPPPGYPQATHPVTLPPDYFRRARRQAPADALKRNVKIAIAVGAASSLFFPFGLFFGPFAIGAGVRAVREGQRSLGWWAIAAGLLGLIVNLAVLVLIATGQLDNLRETLEEARKSK